MFLGSSGAFFFRNPFGCVSLSMLAAGALTLNDSFALMLGEHAMSALRQVNPSAAAKIRAMPGGHNGLGCAVSLPLCVTHQHLCHSESLCPPTT